MKNLIDHFVKYFRRENKKSASIAKERLQVIVAHERLERQMPNYLEKLQKELIQVIGKYIEIDEEAVQVQMSQQGDCSVLELNMVLPDAPKPAVKKAPAKKPAAKKAPVKKTAAKKPAAKKTTTKKTPAKKTNTKKPATKKATAKKTTVAKKTATK